MPIETRSAGGDSKDAETIKGKTVDDAALGDGKVLAYETTGDKIEYKSHDGLDGAGTKTHSQIDTHLDSTSDPHSVTKTQVDLGSVTDDAQLKRSANDFSTFTEKTTPVNADLLLLEDSEASGVKKKIQMTNLPGGSDPDAIHDNVDGEINAIADKAAPVGADVIVIEDSAASFAKKKVSITNLPGGADADAIHDNVDNEIHLITEKVSPVGADELILEDSAASYAKKRVQITNLPAGSPSFGSPTGNIDIGDSAVEGTSGDSTRADHQHQFSAPGAGYPLDVAETESDGSATTPARSDHVHAHGSGYLASAHHAKYLDSEAVQAVEDAGIVLSSTKVITSPDEDLEFTFGRVALGSFATYDTLYVAHRDQWSDVNYALKQQANGITTLNAPTGSIVKFSINNSEQMNMNVSGLQIGADARITEFDTDALDTSDTKVPTNNTVKTYVDAFDHHSETHTLATSGPHTDTLPLTDLAVGSQGSMIRRGAADWEELTKGTNTYVLKAGATDIAWGQIDYSELVGTQPDPVAHVLATTGPHTDTLPLTDLVVGSQGSIIRRGAADWEEYGLGTTNYFLMAGASDVEWTQLTQAHISDLVHTDADAIHDNVVDEIHLITEESSPASTDVLIIESAGNSWAKRRVQITNLPGGADPDAIHDNVANEITAITIKGTPVSADELIIEDSEASYVKKSITIGTLPGGHTRLHAITDVLDHSAANWKVFYSDGSAHIIELALGADSTFLKSNGAAVAPTFEAYTEGANLTDLDDVTTASEAEGDILLRGASVWENLAKGTSGYFLKAGATTCSWAQLVEADISDLGTYLENVVEDTSPQLGGDLDLNEKAILIDPSLATNLEYEGNVLELTVSALTVGQCVYVNGNNTGALADANAVGTMPAIGVYVGTNLVLTHGTIRQDTWTWTAGQRLYVGGDGNLTSTAPSATGDYVQIMGIAVNADTVLIMPSLTEVKHL